MESREEKRAKWLELVQAFDASGLTRREFCAPRGLNAHTLDGWRRRLRSQMGKAPSGRRRAATHPRPARQAAALLVPLRVQASAVVAPREVSMPAMERAALSLRIGGDVRLELPRDIDANWLVTLLRGLR